MNYVKAVDIRWSDIDPNFHLRHSVYYDLGAYCRISFLNEQGITPAVMQELHIGPIIFREECLFKREIRFGDTISINFQLERLSDDFSKWTMRHELWKNGDTLAAVITVEGAWMDTKLRKVAAPGELFKEGFENIPKSATFEWTVRSKPI